MWLSDFLFNNKICKSKNQAKKNCFTGSVEVDGETIWKDIKLEHENYNISFTIGTEFKIKVWSK